MTVSSRAILTQAQRTASRTIDGRAVVIVIDEQVLHTLNPVGTRVWELADGRSVAAIADEITREFAVDAETALADVSRFAEKLRDLGALEVTEP